MPGRCLMAWLFCQVKPHSKLGTMVYVKGCDGATAEHSVSNDKIHTNGRMVLVTVFRDKQGFWVRFPSSAPYRPFRVEKEQLRRA